MQSYNVEIWDTEDKMWKELATCRSTSYNVQDLLPDREYKFRVRAVNVYGTSEPSQESELTAVGEKPEGRLPSFLPGLEINVHEFEPNLQRLGGSEREPGYGGVAGSTFGGLTF